MYGAGHFFFLVIVALIYIAKHFLCLCARWCHERKEKPILGPLAEV